MTGGDNISNIKEMYNRESRYRGGINNAIDFLEYIQAVYTLPDKLYHKTDIMITVLKEILDE